MNDRFFLAVIPIIVAGLIGLIILAVAPAPFSYLLLFLFIVLTFFLVYTIRGVEFEIVLPLKGSHMTIDLVLIGSCLGLLIIHLFSIEAELLSVALYFLVVIFGLGFALQNIIGTRAGHMEKFVMSYPLGLATISILGVPLMFLPAYVRPVVLLITILLVLLTSLSISHRQGIRLESSDCVKIGNKEILLAINLALVVCIYVGLYPLMSYHLGLDIARNYLFALAVTIDNLGEFYYIPGNILFSIYQSSFIYIANPSIVLFQSAAVFLNVFNVLVFYLVATRYLKGHNEVFASIATLIWSLFAGIGWIGFLGLEVVGYDSSFLSTIILANILSYGDITWRRSFFYLSMETSFILVFAVIYYLTRNDLPARRRFLVVLLLVIPIPLMHPLGMYLLFFMLVGIAATGHSKNGFVRNASITILIGVAGSLFLNLLLSARTSLIAFGVSSWTIYIAMPLAIVTFDFLKTVIASRVKPSEHGKTMLPIVLSNTLLGIAFILVILWLGGQLVYDFSSLMILGYVPWSLYPVKLGMMGLLAAVALRNIGFSKSRSRLVPSLYVSLIVMMMLTWFTSFTQLQYASGYTLSTGNPVIDFARIVSFSFREERMFELFRIPLAMIASLALVGGLQRFVKSQHNIRTRTLLASIIIALVLVCGMNSTFLGYSYFREQSENLAPSSSELEIIDSIRESVLQNGIATITSPSTTRSYLDFTGALAIVAESEAVWSSTSPELPLFVTRYSPNIPTYLYLHSTRDFLALSSYEGSYFEHLARTAPVFAENDEVEVRQLTGSFPSSESSAALVVPYNEDEGGVDKHTEIELTFFNPVLSLYYGSGEGSRNVSAEQVTAFNVEVGESADFNGQNSHMIFSTDTVFRELLIEFQFTPKDVERAQVIVSKLDWGVLGGKSWEIIQDHRRIVFKISADGINETVLFTDDFLNVNATYTIRAQYCGHVMRVFVNGHQIASIFSEDSIHNPTTDILIGAEFYKGTPVFFANITLNHLIIMNNIPSIRDPIFSAYDLLTYSAFNYTTVLSTDFLYSDYKTLVLPYDDETALSVITQLGDNQRHSIESVVVLNTNGYGDVLSLFGNVTETSFEAEHMSYGNYTYDIPAVGGQQIDVTGDVVIESEYTALESSHAFVMSRPYDGFQLVYVNIIPLIVFKSLLSNNVTTCITNALSAFFDRCEDDVTSEWFSSQSMLFDRATAIGNIKIGSSSLGSMMFNNSAMIVVEDGEDSYFFDNPASVSSNGSFSVEVDSSEIEIHEGYGFYSYIEAYNASIRLVSHGISTLEVSSSLFESSSINITVVGRVDLLLRQPWVSIEGSIYFNMLKMMHQSTIKTSNAPTSFSGLVSLNIVISGWYSIALPYSMGPTTEVKYDEPLIQFNLVSSIVVLGPYITAGAVLSLLVLPPKLLLGIAGRKRFRDHRQKSE